MISEEQIAQFHRDGFLVLRAMFQGEELEELRHAADAVQAEGMAGEGEHHMYYDKADGSKTCYRGEHMWDRRDIFERLPSNRTCWLASDSARGTRLCHSVTHSSARFPAVMCRSRGTRTRRTLGRRATPRPSRYRTSTSIFIWANRIAAMSSDEFQRKKTLVQN